LKEQPRKTRFPPAAVELNVRQKSEKVNVTEISLDFPKKIVYIHRLLTAAVRGGAGSNSIKMRKMDKTSGYGKQ
jgi:hypothetical protein